MQRRLEAAFSLAFQPPGWTQEDFAHPWGEPALLSPDSVSWLVCKNPVVLFVGGVAAVLLELGGPRVRTGVWENTSFRERPLERLQRTALATALTVYGPRSRAQALITRVARLHQGIEGTTPRGQSFRASDPELLDWVHATASFGFLQAHNEYVQPLHSQERDRYFAESVGCAKLYGASGTIDSQAALDALFTTADLMG